MEVGENIRRAREAQGLRVSEVARRAGMTISGVTFVEEGKVQNPSVDTVLRIARALGVDAGDLLEGVGPKVVALPSTPFTDLDAEEIDERLRNARSAEESAEILRSIEAEGRLIDEFEVRILSQKRTRNRLYQATALDRHMKVSDKYRDPLTNRFKGVEEVARELGGRYIPEEERTKLQDLAKTVHTDAGNIA
jgi:transcriptional regulator with XRE-family HTH domain